MSVTIREVARVAGVSASTVSRVFNQADLVSSKTRARILEVAERLQYVPNAAARSLSIRRTHVLGLLVPLPHSEFFIEMMRGMDDAAQELGFLLLISGSHNRIEDTRTAFRSMKGQVDGFLVVAPNVEPEALWDVLPRDVPAVFLNSSAPGDRYSTIRLTNRDGARAAVQHLLALGHERIAIVKGPAVNGEAQERLEGYQQALRDAGIEPDPQLEVDGTFTRESGVAAGRVLLGLPRPPTAVFASNDLMAIGLLTVFHGAGLRVPDDVAIVGFDDIPMARYVQPALSTVHVPIYQIGRRAVERLVALVEKEGEGEPTADVLETRLVVRASTLGSAYDQADEHPYLS